MTTVEWQTTCTDLKQRGALLLKTEEWADCKLLVGREKAPFRAHKLMLSMASPVFESMFSTEKADQQEIFDIPDMKPKVFEGLVNYIYTENSISSFKSAYRLYVAANRYLIPQLARVCAEYLICNLDMETACATYQVGVMFQDHMLMYESMQLIKLHITVLLHHKSFEEADIDTVADIFSVPDLKVEEMELYQALERYVQAHVTRKRSSAGSNSDEPSQDKKCRRMARKPLKKMRFLTFSLEDFAKGPARSGFFTKGEALAILVNIAGGDAPMPPGFCNIKIPRYKRATSPQPLAAKSCQLQVCLPSSGALSRSASARAELAGRPWRFTVLPYIETGTDNITENYLAVFLRCEDSSAGWLSQVRVQFTLVAAGTESTCKSITCTIEKTFSSTQNEWGVAKFVRYFNAMTSSNGFIANNELTFRAHVVILNTSTGGPTTSRKTI